MSPPFVGFGTSIAELDSVIQNLVARSMHTLNRAGFC